MAINIRVNLAVVVAMLAGELVSIVWQSDALPFGKYEERYIITALCADFALAVILEWITSTRYAVRKWQDAMWLAVCVTLVYAALTAPHTVAGPKSLIALGFISLHKFVVIFVMTLAIFFVRKYSK